jgi:hypothetical protein
MLGKEGDMARMRTAIALGLAFGLFVSFRMLSSSASPHSGAWVATGSMSTARANFTATLLHSGKVLVTGGRDAAGNSLSSAELYDPSTGTWSATGSMSTARLLHSATLLPRGKVLVAGGYDGSSALSSAEIYNPTTGTWKLTGSMSTPRVAHVGTPITVGGARMVLVAGGSNVCGGCDSLDSTELYHPSTGEWSSTGDMKRDRYWETPSPAVLPDGSVFIVGGTVCCPRGYQWIREAEVYEPATLSWTKAKGRSTTAAGRTVLMPDGRVLVAGGSHGIQGGMKNVAEAELFDPSTRSWSFAGTMSVGRALFTMTLLPSGQALVAGGYSGGWGVCNDLDSAELYEPGVGWHLTGAMTTARANHQAILLPSGEVLVVGGTNCSGNVFASAELYEP